MSSSSKESLISLPFTTTTTSPPANVKVELEDHDHNTLEEFSIPIELIKNEFTDGNYHDGSGEDIGRLNQVYFDHTSTIQQNLENVPMDMSNNSIDPLCVAESEHNVVNQWDEASNIHRGVHYLTNHEQTDTEETESTCRTCGRTFPTKKKLTAHIIIHMIEDEEKPMKCEKCGRVYAAEPNLRRHRCRPGPRTTIFMCRTCGASFPTDALRRDHARTHTEVGHLTYACNKCGMSFAVRASLDFHASFHVGDKPKEKPKEVTCDVCGKVLSCLSSLNAHKVTHSGEKPYKCEVCGKSHSSTYLLKSHMGVHTKPFKCKVCGKRVAQLNTLIQHEARHTKGKQ